MLASHGMLCDCFIYFDSNTECGYLLVPTQYNESVPTDTHNLFFLAKIRKNMHTHKTLNYYIKVWC